MRPKVQVKSLSVQNTTLDDVFVHFTGRQLRDEQVKAYRLRDAGPAGDAAMNRMWAIVERELRKFFRSPALMLVSMVFPLVQLIVLGNAFGGKIKDARLGSRGPGPRHAVGEGPRGPRGRGGRMREPSCRFSTPAIKEADGGCAHWSYRRAIIIPPRVFAASV